VPSVFRFLIGYEADDALGSLGSCLIDLKLVVTRLGCENWNLRILVNFDFFSKVGLALFI
jgi:hypothetical protein